MSEILAVMILVPTALALAACVLFVLGVIGMGAASGIEGLVAAIRHRIGPERPHRMNYGTPALHH